METAGISRVGGAGVGAAEEGATGAAWRVSQQCHADLGLADAPPLRLALVDECREAGKRPIGRDAGGRTARRETAPPGRLARRPRAPRRCRVPDLFPGRSLGAITVIFLFLGLNS